MTDNSFNNLYTEEGLDKMIPFLTERKFCYHNPDNRKSITGESTTIYTSKYSYINDECNKCENPSNDQQNNCQEILKTYGTYKEPDDIIKDNIINTFSLNMFEKCKEYMDLIILQNSIKKNDGNVALLNNNLTNDIYLINNSINKIKSENIIKKKIYNSTYYQTNKYKLLINLIINSITIICLYMILNGFVKESFLKIILTSSFIIILFTYLVITILTLLNRKFSNWNIRYFNREPNSKI
tara:strand:+ start:1594 stop:2313 length:720 start_codon:yes stop_codon:yes gene_type:complete